MQPFIFKDGRRIDSLRVVGVLAELALKASLISLRLRRWPNDAIRFSLLAFLQWASREASVPFENSVKRVRRPVPKTSLPYVPSFGGEAQSLHCLGLSVACNPPLIAPFESAPGSFATQPEGKAIRQQGRRG